MKIIFILIATLICQITIADIYVNNKNGSDRNPGKSPDKAVMTLEAGVQRMRRTNDRKLILANTGTPYYESLMFINFSGTPQSPIVIEGNGAVISGLKEIPAAKWKLHKDGIWYYAQRRYGALRPYLVIDGKRVPEMPLAKLKENSHYWSRKGVFFKGEKGKSIKDYKIFATVLVSGFVVDNSSYITCRNLTCEYFSNDGFNVHGDSQSLFFENIIGRRNGDDGFSIHEDVGATVRGGQFYENDFGIQDVDASRSEYYGIVVNKNRKLGINLIGGIHTVVDAVVKDNKWTQIQLQSNYPGHLNFAKDNPHFAGTFYLKNIWVSNGPVGIKVLRDAAVTVSNSFVSNCKTGVVYNGTGSFQMYKSIIQNCAKTEVNAIGKKFHFDLNSYYPGRMIVNGKSYNSKDFKSWQAASKGDASSVIAAAELAPDGSIKNNVYIKNPQKKKARILLGPTRPKKIIQ